MKLNRDKENYAHNHSHRLWSNSKLHKSRVDGRKSIFVLVPGLPQFPRVHPGVDDTISTTRPMSFDHLELIRLGESTVSYLQKQNAKKKSRVCSKVLFLASPNEDEIYKKHLLVTYADTIAREKQHPLEIHIAAHGDQNRIGSTSIGTTDIDLRHKIKDFAEIFDQYLSFHCEQYYDDLKKSPITVVFHSCNSAYADIDQEMSENKRNHIVRTQTLIGKFAAKMKKEGFTNLTVSGYRGYYSHLENKSGSIVTSTNDTKNEKGINAEKAKFTIHPDGKVTTPTCLYFPVVFKDVKVTRLAIGK